MIKKYLSLVLLAIIGQAVQAASDEANYLSIDPFYIEPGGVVTVNLNLINSDEICAYQTDLVLPEGLSVTFDEDEYLNVSVSDARAKRHALDSDVLDDGRVRIVCYSNKNTAFTGIEGAVATISIIAAENIQPGVYEVILKNSEVTLKEGLTSYSPQEYTSSAIVGVTSEGTLTLAGAYNEETIAVLNNALAEKSDINVIDMTKVTSFDSKVNINNPNTLIYTSCEIGVTNEKNLVVNGVCNSLVLTDGYAFSTPTSFQAECVTYSRTLNGILWNALYLPFDVAVSAFGDKYDVACISKVEENEGDLVMVIETLSEGTLSANTPYFVRAKNIADNELSIESEGAATCAAEENTETYTAGATTLDVVGNYQSMTSEELVGCYAISTQGMWQPAKDGSVLRSFRTYLKMSVANGTPAKAIRIRTEGETTAIDNDTMHDSSEESELIYDLQGRRVDNPTKGMYIVNGKKVIY